MAGSSGSSRTRANAAARGQPGRWPPESLSLCSTLSTCVLPHRPLLTLPPLLPPENAAGAFKRPLWLPWGREPPADREAAALGRDAPHFVLPRPPPGKPRRPALPPAPRSLVFCSGREKCYVGKVPGGTGWGHAPCARRAPARSPVYEVRLGVRGPPGQGAPGRGGPLIRRVGEGVRMGGVCGGGGGWSDRSCAGEAWVFGRIFAAGLE